MSNKQPTDSQDIEIGMEVEINPRSDRSRKQLVRGVVAQIHSRDKDHPHGVLVTLHDGQIGRVKRLVSLNQATLPTAAIEGGFKDVSGPSLFELIEGGENHRVEFKSHCLWSANFSAEDIKNHRPQSKELHAYGKAASKIIVAKSIVGFLNSDGGVLIIGVEENKDKEVDEIIGIEGEYEKLRDQTQDGYRRMLVDIIKDYFPSNIFNHMNRYIQFKFEEFNSMTVCGVQVAKSDKHAFLNLNKTDHFFVRVDASTRELFGEEIVEYCVNNF